MPDRPGDMDERDVDARFASIVARWDGPVPAADDLAGDDDQHETSGAARDDDDPTAESASPALAADPPVAEATDTDPTEQDAGEPAAPPVAEATDVDPTEQDAGEPAAPPVTPRAPWVNPSPLDVVVPASAWRAAEPTDPATAAAAQAAEEALADDEHFEPPEVVLPPQEDLHFWGAVIGLVAGPLMLLWVVFARPSHSTRWFIVSLVVSLLGFGLLVLRQPRHRDPTSGDNGARV